MANKDGTLRDNFIYIVLGLWLVNELLSGTNIHTILFWDKDAVNTFATMVTFLALFIQIFFFQVYTRNEVLAMIALSVLIILITYYSSLNYMAASWLFIFASKKLDFNRIVQIVYYILLLTILLVIFLFLIGNIKETVMYRNGNIRHSLGFSHPNFLGMQLFNLTTCRYYMNHKNLKISDFIFALGAALLAFIYPNTLTATFAIAIVSVIFFIFHLYDGNEAMHYLLSRAMVYVAIMCNICSVVLSVISLGGNNVLNMVDLMMSQRFSQSHKTLEYYGIPILGQKISSRIHVRGRYISFFLDNAYMAILIRYGYIMYIVFSLFFLFTMIYLIKCKKYYMAMAFACYSIYGVMENSLFSLADNCFLFLMGYLFFDKGHETSKFDVRKRIRVVFR